MCLIISHRHSDTNDNYVICNYTCLRASHSQWWTCVLFYYYLDCAMRASFSLCPTLRPLDPLCTHVVHYVRAQRVKRMTSGGLHGQDGLCAGGVVPLLAAPGH